jgi:hypothetical protein
MYHVLGNKDGDKGKQSEKGGGAEGGEGEIRGAKG